MQRILSCVLALFLCLGSVAQAETPATKPNVFVTLTACRAAMESGNFRFYEPKYFGLHAKNLPNGEDRIVVSLEADRCVEMLVVGGRQFVVQKEGTLFRAHKLADGSLALYARDDCGNPVFDTILPASAPLPVAVVPVIIPTPIPVLAHVQPTPPPAVSAKKGGFFHSKAFLFVVGGAAVVIGGVVVMDHCLCQSGTVRRR